MSFENTSFPYYSQFIHKSRYARWRYDLGRRETWEETCQRVVDFWVGRFPWLLEPQDLIPGGVGSFATLMYDHLYELYAMGSMRTMMTAGEALDRDEVAGYNPVAWDTKVLTREHGMVEIDDLVGQEKTVLNVDGRWVPATFRSYGDQDTYNVLMKLNSNTVNEVRCTANHRWVLEDGSVVPTTGLTKGDRVPFVTAPRVVDTESIDYKLGILHGLVYGDGTTVYSCGRTKGYHIRLCTDADVLLPLFAGYPVTYPPSAGGDPVVMMYDGFAKTHGLKDLPSDSEPDDYLVGFIRGWLAADGSVTKRSQASLCMNGESKIWFEKYAPKVGYVIQRAQLQNAETNYGKRKSASWVMHISRSSMTKEDLIIPRKADRFESLESHYVVSEVVPSGICEAVCCAEVPDTNTFVLGMGLVTGNCAYEAIKGRGPKLEIMTSEMEDLGFDQPIQIQMKEPIAFDEGFYILLCGTGLGYSVERQYVTNLPTVGKPLNRTLYHRTKKNFPGVSKDELSFFDKRKNVVVVADTKYGWASALRIVLVELYNGNFDVKWDTSKVRPAGAILKTFGGRASGPGPLEDLFSFAVELFRGAKGRKLTSIEVHGLVCKIADIVVVGGVRRSALLSLSNLSDDRMRHAKSGDWWKTDGHYALANNSTAYTEKPGMETFIREWQALVESKSGERGIFNREASEFIAARNGRRKPYFDLGTNPCSEIILRDQQFCNLSESVARAGDTFDTLKRKVTVATLFGTLQSTLVNFKYLNPEWAKNTAEERLLGVSITGIGDHPVLNGSVSRMAEGINYDDFNLSPIHSLLRDSQDNLVTWLEELRDVTIDVNARLAEKLGIPASAAITAIKPSGTVSQLVDASSGIHARHSKWYLRSVRNDIKDPITQFLIDSGIPNEPDVTKPTNMVFYFPIKSPDGAVTRNDLTAIEQLELWKIYQLHWCEHKPSVTVTVREHEWLKVGAWVYENFDIVSGVSFLPHSDHVYQQAPYQDLTEDEYNEWLKKMPDTLDWDKLAEYELEDMTVGSQEYACTGNSCEII